MEDLIQKWDLLDFKPKNGLYTWTNNRVGAEHISAWLEIFLLQSTFIFEKKIISTKILPKWTSDHKPILLFSGRRRKFKVNPLPVQPSLGRQRRVYGHSQAGLVHPCSRITQLCLGEKDKSHQNILETLDKKSHTLPH